MDFVCYYTCNNHLYERGMVMTGETSPWFTYTDEHGATISIHIPNLFNRVEKLNKKIKDLEVKIAQNRQYTTDRTGRGFRYGND